MKKLLFTFLILFAFQTLEAQNLKKAFKQLSKQKFEKAENEFNEILSEDSLNAGANYGLAMIYSHRANKNKDLFKSFKYIKKADEGFPSFDKSQMPDLIKYFTEKNLQVQVRSIDDMLYKEIKRKKNEKLTDRFIKECSNSKNLGNIVEFRDKLTFQRVKRKNTLEAYNNYIEKYPFSKQNIEAKKLRNNIAFNQAKKQNKISAYDNFIKKYPAAQKVKEAKRLRDEIAFASAKKKNTPSAYHAFLKKYPNSHKATEARELKASKAFRVAKQKNTPKAYTIFLKDYHEGTSYQEAFNTKARMLGAKNNKYPKNNASFIKVFDKNNRNDRATSFVETSTGEIIIAGNSKQKNKWCNDAWIVKVNNQGNVVWDKTYGNLNNDLINSIDINSRNEIITVGVKSSTFRRHKGINVSKLDENGKLVWEKDFQGTKGLAVDISFNDDIVVAGYKSQKNGSRDFWIQKLDDNGNYQWNKTYIGKGIANSVKIKENGDVIVSGETWIICLDESGNEIWSKDLGDYVNAYAVTTDMAGNIYIAGRYYNFRKKNKSDFWIQKFDSNGNKTWEKFFNRKNMSDIATSIAISSSNQITVAGYSGIDNKNDNDIWILDINENGNKISEKLFGGNKNEKNPQIKYSQQGNLILIGTKDFYSNYFLVKYK